ncbi:metallophosphoesterase [Shewanella marina]|uniref:metallophosphoesterase n=1 Tax=Shewanella marina TaxID=487319 RepID=UPI0004707DD0|nr:metallophosphoesterase [Shewanella marina]
MKFYVVSDLHIDLHGINRSYWQYFDKDAVLLIAGDTANALNGIEYIKKVLCQYFNVVVMIAGNHEWYSNKGKLNRVNHSYKKQAGAELDYLQVLKNSPIERLKAHSDTTENLYFLDNELITVDGCTIYGGTLWFPIHTYSAELLQSYSRLMNDMEYINLRMIEEQYQAFINNFPDKVDIVLSHHLPSKEAFAVLENADNDYAPFYHAGLSNKLISKAKFWVSGHQHDAVEKVIAGSTTFICNPKGSVPLKLGDMKIKAFYL